ncbi:MAG TPA: cytochrome c biogenesis protein ResB [Desulfosalsimonadaceae bacterium]|nr:cytochrome c biogenesis protein ResB [Desulfosalsimonadaceae bacterium]
MNQSRMTENLINQVWKFFASVKLSVVVLLSLAATSVIGTIIPQNASPMMYIQRYGETLHSIFNALNFFDMYHAWWFQLLMGLLTINIIVCSIDRLSKTWKIIFPKKINFQANRFRKSPNRVDWTASARPEALKKTYESYLSKHYRHITTQETENGLLIFGEKGRWTRLGVYAVHCSILLLVIGGLIGSFFGFEGFANVPEGESVQQISLKNRNQEKKLPFAIRCENFSISHYDSGMPKEYRSTISILNDQKVVHTADIRVNDPLRYGGINIFQSSYGRIPGDKFTVVFTDSESGMTYEKQGAIGARIPMPSDKGTLVVEDFRSNFNFRGHNIGDSFICRIIPPEKQTDSETGNFFILPLSYPRFDRMRGGDFAISINDVEFEYYTGLQITRDPGVPVVYAGFIIIIVGCYITFFMLHKQVGVELAETNGRTSVMLACLSGKNRPGMKAAAHRLAEQLKNLQNTKEL